MSGNVQVRFLGEDAAATPCPYPTDYGSSAKVKRSPPDFPRMHERSRQATGGDYLETVHTVLVVQSQDKEMLFVRV
jgi:hypothetical protein